MHIHFTSVEVKSDKREKFIIKVTEARKLHGYKKAFKERVHNTIRSAEQDTGLSGLRVWSDVAEKA